MILGPCTCPSELFDAPTMYYRIMNTMGIVTIPFEIENVQSDVCIEKTKVTPTDEYDNVQAYSKMVY